MTEKERLLDLISQNQELWEWIQKLDSGTGTYTEVNQIAELLGDRIASMTGEHYSAEELTALLRAGHEVVTETGVVAQQNLNNAARIGLKPITRKFPNSRVQSLVDELSTMEAPAIAAEISRSVPTLMLSMVDDMVSINRDFQAKAGLKPIIVRTWSGRYPSHDTRHTDWCHDLAGTYEYGKEPKNVYARHTGCTCKVEYFPNAYAKANITALAKGEVDVQGVLWNTRTDTLEKRLRKANA